MSDPGWAAFSAIHRDLVRRKVGDRKYDIYRRSTGERVGTAVQTGEHSRDDYPWEGDCTYGVTGAQSSLRDVIDKIASMIYEKEVHE